MIRTILDIFGAGHFQTSPSLRCDPWAILCGEGAHRLANLGWRRNASKFQITMAANDFTADLALRHLVEVADAEIDPQAIGKGVATHAAASDEGVAPNKACTASCVRLSIGKTPVSNRDNVD